MRAYGVEFREGPDGFGVYASKDIEPTKRAKVSHVAFIIALSFVQTLLNCSI